jgi:hypothetical protein
VPHNMALQRTRRPRYRSGRSLCSLGSPLNARPLGGRRRTSGCGLRWLVLGVALILTTGCMRFTRSTSSGEASPSTHAALTATPPPQLVIETLDESAASLPGTTVSVTYQTKDGPRTFTCFTSNRGVAAFRSIPAETVEVSATLTGFTEVRKTQIHLGVLTTTVPVTLKLAPVSGGYPVSSPIPVNVFGTPIWSPSPVATPTPLPPDMRAIRCDPR